MKRGLTFCNYFAMALMMLQSHPAPGQNASSFLTKNRIEQSSLADLGSHPAIESYDLSPDGKTIALLVVASADIGAPFWLLTREVATNHVISKLELGASEFPVGGFALQVLYASGQRYLVVQDLQQIRVFDASSLKLLRTIAGPPSQKPLFILAASKSGVVICAFGSPEPHRFDVHVTPAQLEVVDSASGKLLSEWASEDVPQAVSANGELIAISSSHVKQGILPLDVFDQKGDRISELDGGFSFRKDKNPLKPVGRVRGLFVGDDQILLSPDENVDASGHSSGDSFQMVSVTSKHIQQKIKPHRFKSTGEMAISGDQKTISLISWYISALTLRHDWALPADSSAEALVFRPDTNLHLDTAFPISGFGLGLSGWLQFRNPRISSDGSVIAVAQDSGITVFTRALRP